MQYSNLVLFCPIHNFNVVKQQNTVQQVNLCIFLPHLHIKNINSELRLFSYEINNFNMSFMQINANSNFKYFNIAESWIL